MQLELWTWLKHKKAYWAQHSRSQWLKEGDRNTKFFHTMASIRRCKNTNEQLTVDGNIIGSPDDVKAEVVNFFKKIFREPHARKPIFKELNFQKLEAEQGKSLIAPFSHE